MAIRQANSGDVNRMVALLDQLGYPDACGFLNDKMMIMSDNPNAELWVYEMDDKVVGLIAIDFITQLALKGDFARISYLIVDKAYRGMRIGSALEEHCERLAIKRKCDRIELHCSEHRIDAHEFYKGQGYNESPKYFIKTIYKV